MSPFSISTRALGLALLAAATLLGGCVVYPTEQAYYPPAYEPPAYVYIPPPVVFGGFGWGGGWGHHGGGGWGHGGGWRR